MQLVVEHFSELKSQQLPKPSLRQLYPQGEGSQTNSIPELTLICRVAVVVLLECWLMVKRDLCLVPFLIPEVGARHFYFLEDSSLNTRYPGAYGAIVAESKGGVESSYSQFFISALNPQTE